jgi:hypothetical protein
MFCSYSELCKTELDRRFVDDGRFLKCGPPGTDNKDEPLQINEDAKELWLEFKFVQFAAKWVEGRRSMKRRRMNEACGMQVGAGRVLESKQNVEQQSPQKVVRVAPSLITMPSLVRNLLNKPCLFTIYIPTCS